MWKRIEAITRHPVVNKDNSNTMLLIRTQGNREVIATKAKSFLQLIDGKIQDVNGDQLKVGDYLPASRKMLHYDEVYKLDLRKILPPNKYIYASEIEKAKKLMNTCKWWHNNQNSAFTLPYSRGDSEKRVLDGKGQLQHVSEMINTKTNNICNYEIPENIELDYDFGYLIGAYAAEGCVTPHQISISNNDQDYFVPIQRLCKKFNITTKIQVKNDKNKVGWTSTDIHIYNTLLTKIVVEMCGRHSHNKKLSSHIVFSNRQRILGFLDAYISGDGCVCQHKRDYGTVTESISITSTSRNLLVDTMVMLKNIGITGHINKTFSHN